MLVSCVHPIAILRAVFCTICNLSMFVSDALGDHMVEAYSSTGLVMALYVASMVSLCLPHLVEVRILTPLPSSATSDAKSGNCSATQNGTLITRLF